MKIQWWRDGYPHGEWVSVRDMITDIGRGRFELLPGDKMLVLNDTAQSATSARSYDAKRERRIMPHDPGLGEPKMKFEDTFSAMDIIADHFHFHFPQLSPGDVRALRKVIPFRKKLTKD